MGVQPSHTIVEVVATYEKGVVMTSPPFAKHFNAICKGMVPLFMRRILD
jgi:hypothetical protein